MDGTEQKQDTSANVQDSSVDGKGTSTKTLETSTQEQVIAKAVNDALAKAGRDAKSLSELKQKLEKDTAELTAKQFAWQKKQEEAEEEAVADDIPALTALRDRRAKKIADETKVADIAERESKLAKERETELAEVVERDRIVMRTQLASEIAVEKGVSVDAILKLAKEDTREAMLAVAEVLPPTKVTPVLTPDSGRTNKGGNAPVRGRDKMLAGLASLHPEGK